MREQYIRYYTLNDHTFTARAVVSFLRITMPFNKPVADSLRYLARHLQSFK